MPAKPDMGPSSPLGASRRTASLGAVVSGPARFATRRPCLQRPWGIAWAMPDDHSRRKWSMSADDDAADVESEARRGPSALRTGPRRLGLLRQVRRASRRGGPAFNDHRELPGQCPTTIRAANGRCRLTTTQLTSNQKRDGVPRRFAPDRVAWACCVRAGALRDAAALPSTTMGHCLGNARRPFAPQMVDVG